MIKNKSTNIFRIIMFPPTKEIERIVVEKRNRAIIILPMIFGIIIGFLRSVSNYDSANLQYWYGQLSANVVIVLFVTLIVCFLYSWLVLFLSYLFKGISNFKMTFSMVSYSLIPMIIGGLLMALINLVFIFKPLDIQIINNLIVLSNIIQKIFMLYGFVVLVRGIAIINKFSIIKSLLSSVGLIIFLIILGVIKQIIQ